MNLQELMQKHAGLCDQQQVIVNKAVEEGRPMTEDETTQFNALQTQIDGLAATIKAAEAIEARGAALNEPAHNVPRPHVEVGKNRAEDKPWESFGHYLVAVYEAESGGLDPRNYDKRLKWQAAATGVGKTPADGGFLVEHDMATEIISKGYEESVLAPLCRKVPIGENADGLSVNVVDETSRATGSRWGGVQMYWRGEGDTVTASKPKFRRMDLPLEDLMGLCYATKGMLRDASQLGAIIQQAFSEEIAWMIDNGIVNGNGVGQMFGYLSSGALISVAKETGQAAATIVTKNLSKMWARLWARSRKNAIWAINQDIEPQLDELYIVAGTAGLEPRFITYGPDGTLRIKGRPVIAIEQAATLGTVGDITLFDPTQYVLIDKDAPEFAESVHVRFINAENTFRIMYSVNGKPYWNSALTPANGNNTQSPYVALATRA